MRLCCCIMLICSAAPLFSEDITLFPGSLSEGSLVVENPQFIRVNEYHSYIPELSFTLKNHWRSPWNSTLYFEMAGFCGTEMRRWSREVGTSVGWLPDFVVGKTYKDIIIPLVGKVDGCHADIIRASLTSVLEPISDAELLEVKAKRDAEEAAEAKAAAEAAERERAAEAKKAEQQRADAEEARRQYEAAEAKERQQQAAEKRKIQETCRSVYRNTADKKVADLTVKEEQQVRACQALGLYPPE